jgi:hypothetical protein
MQGLEELFAYGSISKEIDIRGHKVRLNALDAKHLQDALNASQGVDEFAKLLDYKKNVLARAITFSNGKQYIADPVNPLKEEIEVLLKTLDSFHVSIINKLYEFYDELDGEVAKSLEDEVKK